MKFDESTLYNLLPAIYRSRDVENGSPLEGLLRVIAREVGVLEDNIDQLYNDQFIETCSPWVVPYIADLLGIRGISGDSLLTRTPRAEVAHTIAYRRRKGTAAMLEMLAHDTTGWHAHAVEFFQLLATTQSMHHIRSENKSFVPVQDAKQLIYLGGPFETIAHSADVRRIVTDRGKYNIPNIGLFLWRLTAYSLTNSPLVPVDNGGHRFTFNPLGMDCPLFNFPQTEDEVTHLARETNVPCRLMRRVLYDELENLRLAKANGIEGVAPHFGDQPVFELTLGNTPILPEQITICNLKDWTILSQPSLASVVAIDPVLGRVLFADDRSKDSPKASYYYGFSSDIGGGEYNRIRSFEPSLIKVQSISMDANKSTSPILNALQSMAQSAGAIEISDSGRYEGTLDIDVGQKHIELRASDRHRPVIIIRDDPPTPLKLATMKITGGDQAELTLNGMLIQSGGITATGVGLLRIVHCTLVPTKNVPSIIVSSGTKLEIENCILGSLQVSDEASVSIKNSIVDASQNDLPAYAGVTGADHGSPLHIENSTVFGTMDTIELALASNSIFLGTINVQRRQEGCLRFSYIRAGSQTPRRYKCQPENDFDDLRLKPMFVSSHYGDPEYCQLDLQTAQEIRCGADDGSEMGVFHDLFQPQRERYLRARLDEYLRFGLEAGIFYAT